MGKLSRAIRNWVEAEYHFRNAYPNRYSVFLQARYTQAEEELREALTGKRGLEDAARELGLDVDKVEKLWRKWFKKGGGSLVKEREEAEPLPRVRIKKEKDRPKDKPGDSDYAKLARVIMYGSDERRVKPKRPVGKKTPGLFD